MPLLRTTWMVFTVSLCLCGPVAFASSPSVAVILPRGGQRGSEVAVTFQGARLADAQEVISYSPGFEFSKLEAKDNQVLTKVKIAPDCRLGEHAFRVRTATGLSELRTFWVGALPTVDEKEPNNEFTSAQPISLNCTIHGVIASEDVDYFVVDAKKGQRISAEIEGMRLANNHSQGSYFDPSVAILDAKRFELATSDDSPLLGQDGALSILAPADGKYYIQVRECSYRGNAACHYRLHVGTFPRPMAVFPAGGKPGEEIEFRFIGDASGEIRQKVKLPTEADDHYRLHCEDVGGISPSGFPIRVMALANVNEVEPNDARPQATRGETPCAFNGVIEKPGDVDHFRFVAKKGQVLDVHCRARRLGSALDPVIALFNPSGSSIASNDDSGGPDSYVRFTAPADGEYVVSVRDHLGKGGPAYVYRLEIMAVHPELTLSLPQFTQFTQDRQSICVPRGNRVVSLVNTTRKDFGGELILDSAGLPDKVTMTRDPVPAFMTVAPVLFEAAADAPISGKLADLTAKPTDAKLPIIGQFRQRSELIYGQNTTVFVTHLANKAAVAVTEAVPFRVSIVEPKAPLVQNGSIHLKVVAERDAGFKRPITIMPLYNPPGVGSVGSVVIPEGQAEVVLPLNANGSAPVRKWKYAVWATATVGNGPVWVSSQLATVEIAPPMLALQLDRAAAEQGKSVTVFGKVQVATPWEGSAKVKLVGLPAKVTAPEVEITSESKEISIPLTLDPAAPAGQHKSLFCQVVIAKDGESILQNAGSTELRIDKPLANAANAAKTAKPQASSPQKGLSRLEQLRKDQESKQKPPEKKE